MSPRESGHNTAEKLRLFQTFAGVIQKKKPVFSSKTLQIIYQKKGYEM